MKLKNLTDIKAFLEAVNKCTGSVVIESSNGDVFDLKSIFCTYLVVQELKKMNNYDLEVFARKKEDTEILLKFFDEHQDLL